MPPSQTELEPLNVVAKRQKTRASAQRPGSSVPSKTLYENLEELPHAHLSPPIMAFNGATPRKEPLKGRRKFIADLKDATDACANGFEVQGLRLSVIENGEDEGSILCEIVKAIGGAHVLTLNMVVPDTSEYPSSHSFICFAQDEDVPPPLLEVIQDASDFGSRSIQDMLNKIMLSMSKKMAAKGKAVLYDDEMSDGSDAAYAGETDDESVDERHFDDDDFSQYGIASVNTSREIDTSSLQLDFNEIVAAECRPGLTRIGVSELVVSVSVPTFKLAQSIAPRALMAWDSRLLSKAQYFTLMISGIHGKYPVLSNDGTLSKGALSRGTSKLTFRVGLTSRYKPDKEQVLELIRTFGMQESQKPKEEEPLDKQPFGMGYEPNDSPELQSEPMPSDDNTFHFSLSASLEALMNDRFMDILSLRVKYSIGWAAAETVLSKVQRLQRTAERVLEDFAEEILAADSEERELMSSYSLPLDPLTASERVGHLNLPLIAYCYLLRRLTLCSRFCLICYDKIQTDFQALKPYVCSDKLCTYQYYNLNRGPSLEYEICSRPETVDLLVSLTYVAAADGGLEDFPDGMNLQVPLSRASLGDFDGLTPVEKRRTITELLDSLPPVSDMRWHLLRKTKAGRVKLKLQDLDPNVLPAAWSVLRWCVASCTAHLEELKEEEDQVINFGNQYRHFRFTVGAPDAEAKFYKAREMAKQQDENAQKYPSIYGFHGSPAKNWHSIIRNGLWYKNVAHGRAYGDGVYFALDASYSMSGYAQAASHTWTKSDIRVRSCVALAEIVNLPSQFRHGGNFGGGVPSFSSSTNILVVAQTEWIVCRYLLVAGIPLDPDQEPTAPGARDLAEVPRVALDPRFPLKFSTNNIEIPEPTHKLARLLHMRYAEYLEEDFDADDLSVFSGIDTTAAHGESQAQAEAQASQPAPPEDDWVHDPAWVAACVEHIMPAPVEASPMAASSVQREMTAMLKEQERARSLKELGWYMPMDFIGDNLFQWIVELHSFEPNLPVAQDMAARQVNSLVFEVRFPPNFPHSPPFFRILKPRFLPFIQGGGGHVTGGGSMCMDLLTADGWSPAYSVSAILLQIRLAISNLDPRPARLASNWDHPYGMHEAIEGFRRAAATHGWKVPETVNRLR